MQEVFLIIDEVVLLISKRISMTVMVDINCRINGFHVHITQRVN